MNLLFMFKSWYLSSNIWHQLFLLTMKSTSFFWKTILTASWSEKYMFWTMFFVWNTSNKALFIQSFPYEHHCECYKKLALRCRPCYLHLPIFSYTCTLLFCGKIISYCDRCFPQQIRPQTTSIMYITRLFLDWGLVSIWIKNTTHCL